MGVGLEVFLPVKAKLKEQILVTALPTKPVTVVQNPASSLNLENRPARRFFLFRKATMKGNPASRYFNVYYQRVLKL